MRPIPVLLLLSCTGAPPDEEGVDCTAIGCESSFELRLTHDLPLDGQALHTLVFRADPVGTVECTIGPAAQGSDSCFGFRFADVAWTEEAITLTLSQPFFVSDATPDGEPFAAYEVEVQRAGTPVFTERFDMGTVEGFQPNGPECGPTCYQESREHDVRSE